jgi:hypothetical protein
VRGCSGPVTCVLRARLPSDIDGVVRKGQEHRSRQDSIPPQVVIGIAGTDDKLRWAVHYRQLIPKGMPPAAGEIAIGNHHRYRLRRQMPGGVLPGSASSAASRPTRREAGAGSRSSSSERPAASTWSDTSLVISHPNRFCTSNAAARASLTITVGSVLASARSGWRPSGEVAWRQRSDAHEQGT